MYVSLETEDQTNRRLHRVARLTTTRVLDGAWCDSAVLPDGRLRLTEHFRWNSRDGEGTNIIEETDE